MSPEVGAQRLEGQREIAQPEWAEFLAVEDVAASETPLLRESPLLATPWWGSADNDASCDGESPLLPTPWRGSPDKDASSDDPAIEVESWARRASTASGFGDIATAAWPTSQEVYELARRRRALVLGNLIAAGIRATAIIARRVYAWYQRRQEAKALDVVLRQMDEHMLRDIGFHHSEITSAALDATGVRVAARALSLWTSQGPAR